MANTKTMSYSDYYHESHDLLVLNETQLFLNVSSDADIMSFSVSNFERNKSLKRIFLKILSFPDCLQGLL